MAGSHMIAENIRKVVPYGKLRTVSVLTELNDEGSDFEYEVFFEVNPYSRFVLQSKGETREEAIDGMLAEINKVSEELPSWSKAAFDLLDGMEEAEVEMVSRRDLKNQTYSFEKVVEEDNVALFKGNVKEDLYSKYYVEIHLNDEEVISVYATGTEEESAKTRLVNEINKNFSFVKEDLEWTKEFFENIKN